MPASSPPLHRPAGGPAVKTELVIITGVSGSGKGTVLKALEDLGYYSVDNLPIELIPKFAELVKSAPTVRRPVPTKLLFLEADDSTLIRRFSETRRPHPLGTGQSVAASIRRERAAGF